MDGWTDRPTDRQMTRETDQQRAQQRDGWKVEQTDRLTNKMNGII